MPAREKILLIRLKSIGDVLLTLPAVNAVRQNFPGAKITFLTSKENAELLRGFREVDEIIALDRAAFRSKNPFQILPEFFALLKKLRAEKFSLAVDFQGYGETALFARLTGARERWGSVYARGRRWAYTRGVPRARGVHAIERNLEMLRECGLKIGEIKNEFFLPPDALAAARKFFSENNLDEKKFTLYLQPFTSSPHKNWPLKNYLAVAECWRGRGAQIIFGGGPNDRAALEPAQAQKFSVCAGVPLLVTGGLVKLSALAIGGDTGILHLANALGQRALMLVTDKNPGQPILFQRADWVLASETKRVADISVETVNEKIAEVFSERN